MTSAYSTNLAIELIGTGDQAGAWGTTTNTNLGTLIEQAISGYTTQAITDGADTVLTMNPGASAVARNMVIECTGTLTAARNLVVPANKKLYFIYNNTSGGFAVTVKVIGLTGVSVPSGKKMVLVCNGTDVVVAENYLVGTLDGSVTAATTATTQAPGTNTTQIANTAFVQAAVAATMAAMYPVGSIYTNATNNTNPATLFGFGTWVSFGAGQMPVGFSSGDPLFGTAGNTGGSRDATLPTHNHNASTAAGGAATGTINGGNPGDFGGFQSGTGVLSATGSAQPNRPQGSSGTNGNLPTMSLSIPTHTHSVTVDAAGSSATNANLPPYITVYMWKRTA